MKSLQTFVSSSNLYLLLKSLVSALVCLRIATMFWPNMTLDTEL